MCEYFLYLVFTVPFRGPPSYNPRRRSGIYMMTSNGLLSPMGTLTRVPSEPRMTSSLTHHVLSPPSPCSSDRSSAAPFSSASSSLSDNSSGTGSVHHQEDNASIVTGNFYVLSSFLLSKTKFSFFSKFCDVNCCTTTVNCLKVH